MKSGEIRVLLHVVDATRPTEIDCAAFLEQVAVLVETRLRGDPLSDALRPAEDHERVCANCREECAALTALLTPPGT